MSRLHIVIDVPPGRSIDFCEAAARTAATIAGGSNPRGYIQHDATGLTALLGMKGATQELFAEPTTHEASDLLAKDIAA